MVPVVYIDPDPAQQRMATVRHNRARGHHHVVKMADIVVDLIDSHGVSREDVMTRLGMEREEVDRLYQRGEMVKRGARAEFNKGWVPK
jgi:ParB-like chromosome segregation protein Spo0J